LRPMRVYLADLVHTWEKVSVWTIPVNIGFVGGYARKVFPDIELTLFKRPEELLPALRQSPPDVLGLSCYVWNQNLSGLAARIARSANPNVLVTCGGPVFTDLNADEAGVRAFFSTMSDVDAYTLNQGERPFAELLAAFDACGRDVARLRARPVPGCLVNDLRATDTVHVSAALPGFDDLDEIPSPYLTGLMDPFFEEPYLPLIETNRSCPYRCAYCAWGIGSSKLTRFSMERVLAEVEYIGSHCTKYGTMMTCDANFGILERDAEIARAIRATHEKYGFPQFVNVQWDKSNPPRIARVAREFGGIASVGASFQSHNEKSLEAIGRKNLPLEEITPILRELKAPLFTELILGLPHETAQTHLDANRVLMDEGFEINNYNLHLLPGTRMDSAEYRRDYVTRTGYRLHDNAWGIYDGQIVMEAQEVVLATPTMPVDELRAFRFLHFLFQFMWSKEWYRVFLRFWKEHGLHPVELMRRVGEETKRLAVGSSQAGEHCAVAAMRRAFDADHDLENFDSAQELYDYWRQPANFDRLGRGDYGKLNMQYTFEILLGCHAEFGAFLLELSTRLAEELNVPDRERFLVACRDVLAFQSALRFDLEDGPPDEHGVSEPHLVRSRTLAFDCDVLSWVEGGMTGELAPAGGPHRVEFYLPPEQEDFLQKRLEQFRSKNRNMTLRKMAEYLGPKYLLNKTRRA